MIRRRRYIERSPLRRPRMTRRRSLKALADKLCGAIVRARGACENCGSTKVLQWAHGLSRSYHNVRWDFRVNGFCLCRACHCYFTYRPEEWRDWMVRQIGQGEYDRLRARAMMRGGKPDLAAVVLMLQRGAVT